MILTRNEFLSLLESQLSPLPPEEREELMEDYKAHFAFGLQGGKSESEIIAELGDPYEIAQEAIGQRPEPQPQTTDPVYWYYNGRESAPQGSAVVHPPAASFSKTQGHRRNGLVSAVVYIWLFFMNLAAIPLFIGLWSGSIGIAIGAAGGILSPVLLLLDYLQNQIFYPAKGFAVITLVGIGILLLLLAKLLFRGLLKLSILYMRWNAYLARGGKKHD